MRMRVSEEPQVSLDVQEGGVALIVAEVTAAEAHAFVRVARRRGDNPTRLLRARLQELVETRINQALTKEIDHGPRTVQANTP